MKKKKINAFNGYTAFLWALIAILLIGILVMVLVVSSTGFVVLKKADRAGAGLIELKVVGDKKEDKNGMKNVEVLLVSCSFSPILCSDANFRVIATDFNEVIRKEYATLKQSAKAFAITDGNGFAFFPRIAFGEYAIIVNQTGYFVAKEKVKIQNSQLIYKTIKLNSIVLTAEPSKSILTCYGLKGKNCKKGKYCSGRTVNASDSNNCCIGNCLPVLVLLEPEPISSNIKGNVKNSEKYSEKEVFLISGKDWRRVLGLVPISVFDEEGKAKKFPLLIYHEEGKEQIKNISLYEVIDKLDFSLFDGDNKEIGKDKYYIDRWKDSGGSDNNPLNNINIGEKIKIGISVQNLTSNAFYAKKIRLNNLPSFLKLENQEINVNLNIYSDKSWYSSDYGKYFEFSFDRFPLTPGGFDADSIIYFLQQFKPSKATIIGSTPQELDDLLIAPQPIGADLSENALQRILPSDYFGYWKNFDSIVVVDYFNYNGALMATTYASLINAPIIFANSQNINQYSNVVSKKNVILVGGIDSFVEDFLRQNASKLEKFSLEELQKKYLQLTKTNKVILVNPTDLSIEPIIPYEWWQTDKSNDLLGRLYAKTSLVSPILASAKHEIILASQSHDVNEIDDFLQQKLDALFGINRFLNKTCGLGDSCSNGFEVKTNHFFTRQDGQRISFRVPKIDYAGIGLIKLPAFLDNCTKYANGDYLYFINNDVEIYGNDGYPIEIQIKCLSIESPKAEIIIPFNGIFLNEGNLSFETETYSGDLEAYLGELFLPADEKIEIIGEKKEVLYSCSFSDKACAQNLSSWDKRIFVSSTDTAYAFSELETGMDYYLTIELNGGNSSKVFFNDNFVGQINSNTKKLFIVNKNFVSKNSQIKIVPDNSMVKKSYSAKVQIRPKPPVYFLTIAATPESIPNSQSLDSFNVGLNTFETDGRVYGSFYNYELMDLAVGRIFGINSSDASSYIARDLFYDSLPKKRSALLALYDLPAQKVNRLCRELGKNESECLNDKATVKTIAKKLFWSNNISSQFQSLKGFYGDSEVSNASEELQQLYSQSFLMIYMGHGSNHSFSHFLNSWDLTQAKMYLQPGLLFGSGCFTCSSYYANLHDPFLLCSQAVRRGLLAFQGAVDLAVWYNTFDDALNETFLNGKSIGEAYMIARNNEYIEDALFNVGDLYYTLIGDPTWEPKWWN